VTFRRQLPPAAGIFNALEQDIDAALPHTVVPTTQVQLL
jgi:hypothetical protein